MTKHAATKYAARALMREHAISYTAARRRLASTSYPVSPDCPDRRGGPVMLTYEFPGEDAPAPLTLDISSRMDWLEKWNIDLPSLLADRPPG